MARDAAVLALVASTLLLAGCAAAPPLPPGLSEQEVRSIMHEQNRDWWNQIAPGEPMPEIEPIEYLEPGQPAYALDACLAEASQADQNLWERASFVCSMQYPYVITDADDLGYLSAAQLDYLWDYFSTRLTPCLELMGYDIGSLPSEELFTAQPYLSWAPYYSMNPMPESAQEWRRIDARCPVPVVGSYWRPGADVLQ